MQRVRTTYVAWAHGADTSAIEVAHEEMNRFSGQTSPWVHNVPFLIPLSFSPAAVSTLATIAMVHQRSGGSFYGSMLRGLLKFPLIRSGVARATVFVINVSGSIKFP